MKNKFIVFPGNYSSTIRRLLNERNVWEEVYIR